MNLKERMEQWSRQSEEERHYHVDLLGKCEAWLDQTGLGRLRMWGAQRRCEKKWKIVTEDGKHLCGIHAKAEGK